jgi:cytochrome c-type biogenesis protein CcmH/NrfG
LASKPLSAASEQQAYAGAVDAFEAGEHERGLRLLEPFVASNPQNYRFWHLRGLLQRALGRREEALQSLQRAVRLDPAAPKPAAALATTLYEAGLPSLQAHGAALRLDPANQQLVMGLASALIAEGEPDSAIAGLEQVLHRSPHWVEGHVLLAKLRWAQGEREGFTRSFDDALRILPQSRPLRVYQMAALVHAEQWAALLAAVARGRAAIGDDPEFDIDEAIAFAELGDAKRAEELFAPHVQSNDMSTAVHVIRHYLRTGRPDEAEAVVARWLDKPEAFAFWPYASVTWRMLGDPRWEWLEGDERFVGIYDIADRLPPLDQLAATLRKLHTLSGQPLEQSLRGGTQTDGDIFTHIDPVLVQLREAIRETVAEHAAQLPPRDPRHPLLGPPRAPINFSGGWSVRLQEGGYHANHVHPMGWISSALYVVLPDDLGEDQAGFLTIGDPGAPTLQLDVAAYRTVEPRPGRLVLFPSYSWHGTRPFGTGERITVAFDVAVPK